MGSIYAAGSASDDRSARGADEAAGSPLRLASLAHRSQGFHEARRAPVTIGAAGSAVLFAMDAVLHLQVHRDPYNQTVWGMSSVQTRLLCDATLDREKR